MFQEFKINKKLKSGHKTKTVDKLRVVEKLLCPVLWVVVSRELSLEC